ncbi:hypothetical protein L4D06_11250 [Enterovibrio makurazakiensis]|uniref:hypothetical protein n=1 Tax=Enterovibrio makurazakiensis TaxID=2910232 RepID=UPI003D1EC1AC
MILRPELQPPQMDLVLFERLVALASDIDGGSEEECQSKVHEFNLLSETNHEYVDFQGIYGGAGHEDYVCRLLRLKSISPQFNVTECELIEITRLAVLGDEAYLDILEKNVTYPSVSDLIYYPENVSGLNSDDPTIEEIVTFLLEYKVTELASMEKVKLLTKHIDHHLCDEEFRVLSENLAGFELNYLSGWIRRNNITVRKTIELIESGKITSDYAGTVWLKL